MQATILNWNQEELLNDVQEKTLKEQQETCYADGASVTGDQINTIRSIYEIDARHLEQRG